MAGTRSVTAALMLIMIGASLSVHANSPPSPDPATTSPVALLRSVPQTPDEVRTRLALAEARIEELRPTTQPATSPVDEDPDVTARREQHRQLLAAWEAYRTQLQRAAQLEARVQELSAESHLATVSQEVEKIEQATRNLRTAALPTADQQNIEALRSEIQELETTTNVLAEEQTRRSTQLATGLDEQRQQTETHLKTLRQKRETLRTGGEAHEQPTTAPAPTPATETGPSPQRELVDVQIATEELALRNLTLERQRTQLLFSQNGPLLEARRAKLALLRKRLATLVEEQGRTRVQQLEAEQTDATRPVDQALIDLKLFHERVLLQYFQEPGPATAARIQRLETQLETANTRIRSSRAYWNRVDETLEFRSGDELSELQRQARSQQRDFSDLLARLQQRNRALLDQAQEWQTVRDRALERSAELAAKVTAATEELEPLERARLETELTAERTRFEQAMQTALERILPIIERIESTSTQITAHVDELDTLLQSLHWQRLGSRDAGLLETEWPTAWREARALWTGLTGTAAADSSEENNLATQLFGEQRDTRRRAQQLLQSTAASLQAVSTQSWMIAAGGVLLAALVGVGLWRWSRHHGVTLAQEIRRQYLHAKPDEGGITSGVSGRFNLATLNMIGDLAIPGLVAAALIIATSQLIDDTIARNGIIALVTLLVGSVAIARLVHHLFEADSPPHRLIPCPNHVASHYRWWLTTLIAYTVLVLLVPMLIYIANVGYAVQSALIEVFKAGLLLLLLLFLLPKRRVLGPALEAHARWPAVTATALYPVAFLITLALFVMQVAGFGALVTYVGAGLMLTLLVILAFLLIPAYLNDMLDYRLGGEAGGGAQTGRKSQRKPPARERPTYYVLFIIKTLVRLAVLLGTLAALLWTWNVPLKFEALTWQKLGGAGLTILAALVIDRLLVAALVALQRSERLPESLTHLVRRWARLVLTVIAVLIIVAIAGWRVENLWTFLTTLLAMVAIGFVAVWSILSNLLATFVILIWRPFNVGEHIELVPDGIGGQVVDISFMYTILKTEDGQRTSVPNNLFAQKLIKRQPGRGVPQRSLAEQLEREEPLSE